jgi:hypothetical protein
MRGSSVCLQANAGASDGPQMKLMLHIVDGWLQPCEVAHAQWVCSVQRCRAAHCRKHSRTGQGNMCRCHGLVACCLCQLHGITQHT